MHKLLLPYGFPTLFFIIMIMIIIIILQEREHALAGEETKRKVREIILTRFHTQLGAQLGA